MTKENGIIAWSYSRLSCYEQCPRLFKYRNIDKKKEPKAYPMLRGIKIHNEAGKFLASETDIFPESCLKFKEQFYELLELNPIVEQRWAFTAGWKSVGYFDKKTWLRVTLDVGLDYKDGHVEVIDHKTGKFHEDNPSYDDQGVLFAAALIKKAHGRVNKVTCRLWFLDSGDELVMDYTRDEVDEKMAALVERAETMLSATRFPPKPGWYCGGVKKDGTVWGCHFRKSNGGCCEFG